MSSDAPPSPPKSDTQDLSPANPLVWHGAAVLACLAAAAVATSPLVLELRTHLAGPGRAPDDSVCFFWNNWWVQKALGELRAPYLTDYLLSPNRLDLRLHTLGLLYGVLFAPVFGLLGAVTVVNVQILATAAVNGYSMFLLVRRLFGGTTVAMICGAAFSAIPAVGFHFSTGRPSCAAIWPALLSLLYLDRLLESGSWRHCAALTLSLLALVTVDQQMAIFGTFLLASFLVWRIASGGRRLLSRRLGLQGFVTVLVLCLPLTLLYARPLLEGADYTVPHPSEALAYSIPPFLAIDPRHLWRIYGILLPLGLLGAFALVRRERHAAFAVLFTLGCLVLTLGPVLSGTKVPMPFALVRLLPGLEHFRTPYRFQIPAAVGMTLALASLLTHLSGRLTGPDQLHASRVKKVALVLSMAVGVDVVAHRMVGGFATHKFAEEPVYRDIAQVPGNFAILEVPFGVRSGTSVIGRGDDLMFYQPVHGKRLINGYLSRIPVAALDTYSQMIPSHVPRKRTLPPRVASQRLRRATAHPPRRLRGRTSGEARPGAQVGGSGVPETAAAASADSHWDFRGRVSSRPPGLGPVPKVLPSPGPRARADGDPQACRQVGCRSRRGCQPRNLNRRWHGPAAIVCPPPRLQGDR